jgi:hypothetical protein
MSSGRPDLQAASSAARSKCRSMNLVATAYLISLRLMMLRLPQRVPDVLRICRPTDGDGLTDTVGGRTAQSMAAGSEARRQ